MFALALLPHQTVLHYLLPVQIFGKNLWLVVPLGIALSVMTYLVFTEGARFSRNYLLLITLLWTGGLWVGLGWHYISSTDVFVNTRPLLIFPLALLAATVVTKDNDLRRWLMLTFVAQGVLQAVVGLMHIHVFPNVVTGTFAHLQGVTFFLSDEWWLYTSREAGTLGNPSAYAEMICLGAFAICFFFAGDGRQVLGRETIFICIGMWFLFFLATLASLSRVGAVFVSLPFCILMFDQLLRAHWGYRRWLLGGSVVLLSTIGLLVAIKFPELLARFQSQWMYPRAQTAYLLLNALTEDARYFMAGLPSELLLSLRTPEGYGFGDNSFLRLAAATGIPIFSFWVALNAYILTKGRLFRLSFSSLNWLRTAFLIYLLVLLYLGDVLFNDGWILMCALLLNSYIEKPSDISNFGFISRK